MQAQPRLQLNGSGFPMTRVRAAWSVGGGAVSERFMPPAGWEREGRDRGFELTEGPPVMKSGVNVKGFRLGGGQSEPHTQVVSTGAGALSTAVSVSSSPPRIHRR